MKRSGLRPTAGQATVLTAAVLLVGLGAAAALFAWWSLAVVALLVLVLGLVALVLYTGRLATIRLQHQTAVLQRQLDRAAADGMGADRGSAVSGALAAMDHWSQQLLGTATGRQLLLQRAKRTRSIGVRDLLAHAASGGAYRYDALTSVLESWRDRGLERVREAELKGFWWPAVRTLAQLLYSQRTCDRDLLNSLTLYELLLRTGGMERLDDVDRSHYADLCVDRGRMAEAEQVLAARGADTPSRTLAHTLFAANAANPYLGRADVTEEQWLARVNTVLTGGGFEPLQLTAGDKLPFFRLGCPTGTPVPGGPLVSVLMPIYQPDAATDKAVESILAQTWRHLELVMIDDGSPAVDDDGCPTGHAEQLRAWAERDPRVRLVLNEENRGAYHVRNQAYDLARGEFVTVADKDDWHHPQQLEWQVRDLQAEPGKVANITSWARVSTAMRFLVRWGPDRVVHPSIASTMFRRAEIRERLGYWDAVRKGADNEFRFRLQLVYGVRLNPTELTPLTFSLMGEGNLTFTDLGLGYEHEDRGAYRHAYLRWHDQIATGASARLDRSPDQRPFPAPASFLPERAEPGHFDVVHLVELDSTAARNDAVRAQIEAALAAGLRVGVVPTENFLGTRRPRLRLDPRLDELIQRGEVTRLATAQPATTDLLVVRPPGLLQICRDARAALQPGRVVLVADELPWCRHPRRHHYEVDTVSRNAQTVFGVEPGWAATTDQVRRRLARLLLRDQLEPGMWTGSLAGVEHPGRSTAVASPDLVPVRSAAASPKPSATALVVGGYRNDRTADWLARLGDCGPDLPGAPVVRRTELQRRADVEADPDGLDGLDVWVGLTERVEEENVALAREAADRGVALVLSPVYQPVFGSSAVYTAAAEPGPVLSRLLGADDDPDDLGDPEDDGEPEDVADRGDPSGAGDRAGTSEPAAT